jgi:hypothetical protein
MFTENIPAFFADFGVAATLGGNAVRGVFDNGFALGSVGLVGMSGTQPTYTLPTASVTPADPVGQPLVIGAEVYAVAAHEPDGTGVSRLVLELAP